MAHQVVSSSIQGIDARRVLVQIDSAPGIHTLSIVGLADKAVQESQDRINSAIRNSGLVPPEAKNRRYTVNLAPADMKKEGALFDLPIAVAYLLESRQLAALPQEILLAGELSLDGTLSRINGALAIALLAKKLGFEGIIVPRENAAEAGFIKEVRVFGADTLSDVFGHLSGARPLEAVTPGAEHAVFGKPDDSFAYIQGQHTAKRAITIAAAGGHNVLMKGPPGSGKTLLARSLPGLLPPLTSSERLEVVKIYSAIGLMHGSPAQLGRPFRSPHHTSSPAAIVGGGTWPRPGEISLAHRGVLFLDELPEFARNVLESLRQPLEDGVVTISRASGTLTLPAKFLLIAAMNPCPCGNYGDPRTVCACAPAQVMRYSKKISGPLLDRIDIQISVPRETVRSAQKDGQDHEAFTIVRNTIESAYKAQEKRLSDETAVMNSEISHKDLARLCPIEDNAAKLMESVVNRKNLSQRALQKIHKVAQTIADMEQAEPIREQHVAEACALRINESI